MAFLTLLGEHRVFKNLGRFTAFGDPNELIPNPRVALPGHNGFKPTPALKFSLAIATDLFCSCIELRYVPLCVQLQKDDVGGLNDILCKILGLLQSQLSLLALGHVADG